MPKFCPTKAYLTIPPPGHSEEYSPMVAEELEEEEEVVTLDAQRIFLLMRKEYRSRDNRTYRTN